MTTSTAAGNPARTQSRPDGLLRLALRLDAVVTGLNGAAYLVGAALLDDLLGLPPGLLRGVGAFLLVYAAAVWLVGARTRPSTPAVEAVVVLNGLWAVGSVVVVLTDRFTPTTVGAVWLVLQALVVAGFAALQLVGLRRRA
ncbi:hypothetical protein [Blastococcus haudaquaticus]|uniref:Integral membrane protein n=1 Tax=Blastococcus haudaquaticus TaxID=1938745 RepID=A0A286H7W3_9ACTN|nr:hypothetical protein [Blastococcus haudaquaticus]SOE03857.1 hypothetical protein SAMN06272739_4415 [Blastococcus haudaquaticus]